MTGGSGWVSNPPRLATRPATGFEDREALRDLTTPGDKDTRMRKVKQGELKGELKIGHAILLHGIKVTFLYFFAERIDCLREMKARRQGERMR
jgi:hypothetical protein